MVHDVWVEVDLGALRHNFAQVKNAVGENVRVMAVVKGNGFGHGYVEPSRAFVEAGADYLAVTRIDEALPIRHAGITAPILLFAPIQLENAELALESDLDMSITSLALAQAVSAAAEKMNKAARVFIKVDTGMGRLGLLPREVWGFLQDISKLPNLEVAGVYTHFATALEAEITPSRMQFQAFQTLLQQLKEANISYGAASAANSAAILRMPESHLDIVRCGTLLYGQYPSQHVPRKLDLKPTWKLKARICEIRSLPKGSPTGYGREHTTIRDTRAAVIPIGFADGFTLVPEGPIYRQSLLRFAGKKMKRRLAVDIRGQKAPVLGRVAMQLIVVDVTDVEGVRVGDEVSVPAMRIPTSALIPRVYADSAS